jgi:DNA mismatch repair protein MutS2
MSEVASPATQLTLEFPVLLEAIAAQAQTPMGGGFIRALEPLFDLDRIEARQAEVAECRQYTGQHGYVALAAAEPVTDLLRSAAVEGTVLEPDALLAVGRTARVANEVRERLAQRDEEWPHLAALAGRIADFSHLVRQVEAVLDEEGEIRDRASPELARLRGRRRRLRTKVMTALEQIVNASGKTDVLQERLVTQRGGRYVVPVRAEKRGSLKGVLHDTSSSGQTLYVEPLAVLDQQNALAEATHAEEQEIQRILAELTGHVRGAQEALRRAEDSLAHLDALQAISRFADLTEAVRPELREDGLRLRAARHPLMIETLRDDDSGVDFIPLDLELQPDDRVLIITGPNTGGKTVVLKTVGVLAMMAQCGLPVPANEARLPCCPRIYADIGDDQSIVANLSTFSAHLTRINSFLQDCPANSLVLLDELGTGTDPAEGSALGIALVEAFDSHGALTLASTHHDSLKAFAHGYPSALNAAMEFDSVSLQPTYRLRLGLPGRSNAFEIAARLGVEDGLLDRARGLMQRDNQELDSLIRNVEGQAEALASDRAGLEQERRELQDSVFAARQKEKRVTELLEQLRADGKAAIRETIDEVRQQGEKLLAELAEQVGEAKRGRAAADRKAQWAATVSGAESATEKTLSSAMNKLTEGREKGASELWSAGPEATAADLDEREEDAAADAGSGELLRGEAVVVRPLNLRGTVARDWLPGGADASDVEVDVRGKRLLVERDRVRKLV